MGYREEYFKHHPGKKMVFRRGTWYQCVDCRKWFLKSDITIDHRIPKRKGGTDDLWNLQPMCRSCNSAKRERQSKLETVSTLARATAHGQLGKAVGGMAVQGVKDALHIKYKRR